MKHFGLNIRYNSMPRQYNMFKNFKTIETLTVHEYLYYYIKSQIKSPLNPKL